MCTIEQVCAQIRTVSQENSALSCVIPLAEAALLRWATNIAARSPWLRREANPPIKTKIAKIYATVARIEVNSDIW